jgi:hypothetical protein
LRGLGIAKKIILAFQALHPTLLSVPSEAATLLWGERFLLIQRKDCCAANEKKFIIKYKDYLTILIISIIKLIKNMSKIKIIFIEVGNYLN